MTRAAGHEALFARDSGAARAPLRARGVTRWIAGAPALAILAAACGAPAPTSTAGREATGSTSQAIYGGIVDDDGSGTDAVVAIRVGDDAQQFTLCSGALVAPNVVLTAHHCVGTNVAQDLECDQNGVSATGAQVGPDVDPSTLHVFVGAHANVRYGAPTANGKAIFHPGISVLCNEDIALVVLDTPITGVAPLAIRLTPSTREGDTVRAVGYGQNDANQPVGTRMRRDGVLVKGVGSAISASGTPLGPNEMELGESICEGDSGGPAISEETGAIVGVVSRGGACTDDFGHVYALTSGFAQLIGAALSAAGAQALSEPVSGAAADGGARATTASGASGTGADADGGAGAAGSRDMPAYTTYEAPRASACAARVAPASDARPAAWPVAAIAIAAARRRRKR